MAEAVVRVATGRVGIACAILGVLLAASANAQVIDGRPTRDYWLLTEFAWGDDPEVVLDSLEMAPGFVCFKSGSECRFVRVSVDGEDLWARFDYREERLWQVRFVTPDLDRRQTDENARRVWTVLSGYVERIKGPPTVAGGFPKIASVSEEAPGLTHFWKLPDMEIRIEVGRNGRKFYVGAFFYDPTSSPESDE